MSTIFDPGERPGVAIKDSEKIYAVRRIYTGTPSGVGAVQPGDDMECYIAGLKNLSNRVRG